MTNARINQTQSGLLDAIRYVLASVVVIGHGFGFFLNYFEGFFPRVFPHPQSIAVVCFFYLSGFLIVGSQLGVNSKSPVALYKYLFDRGVRVYVTLIPSLIFVSLSDFLISRIIGKSNNLVEHYTNIGIFINNLFLIPSMPYGTMRPIWSLMYEWWIYVLFGGVFFCIKNFVIAPILILFGFYYVVLVGGRGEAGPIWLIWTLGGICAFLQDKIRWMEIRNSTLNFFSVLFFVAIVVIYFISKDAYNIFAGLMISLFLFVFINLRGEFFKVFLTRRALFKKLAGFSFTLFLTHYTVLTYVKEFLGIDGWIGLIFGFIASNFVALAIASVTECRLSNMKIFLINILMRRKSSVVKR